MVVVRHVIEVHSGHQLSLLFSFFDVNIQCNSCQ